VQVDHALLVGREAVEQLVQRCSLLDPAAPVVRRAGHVGQRPLIVLVLASGGRLQ
jgi:hypothetical protein